MLTLLDALKAPMDPAWVSVLRISCSWARGINQEATSDPDNPGAAEVLTTSLHYAFGLGFPFNTYPIYVCYPPDPTQGEYFFLKLFLQTPRTASADIADFLCCLMTSLGLRASIQRTNPPPFPAEYAFQTNRLRLIGVGGYAHFSLYYHQFVLYNYSPTTVYDACITFHPSEVLEYYPGIAPDYGNVYGWHRENTYRPFLINPNRPYIWAPGPEPSGLIPGVYASDEITCQK